MVAAMGGAWGRSWALLSDRTFHGVARYPRLESSPGLRWATPKHHPCTNHCVRTNVYQATLTHPARPLTTRLAPSPTGALHLGNARTFLVTWALARRLGWRIVLRVEDLDTPRVKPGVLEQTVQLLAWLGMDWDEGPLLQSGDLEHHREAMERLVAGGMAYPSDLTRAQIQAAVDVGGATWDEDSAQSAPQEGGREVRFPASLRPSQLPAKFSDTHAAWRFTTPAGDVEFLDMFAGLQRHSPRDTIGDFVVWTHRTQALGVRGGGGGGGGQPAYQLAVVVDDHRQGVTHVVRGDDLLDSAARQVLLMRALGLGPEPRYCHLPLVRGADGRRLAKRHGDTRLDVYRARGVAPERVIGLLAEWCGMGPRRPMSAGDFRATLDLHTIPHAPAVFRPEDDRWLLQT
jgi:glutamyl-tRNA synthetase